MNIEDKIKLIVAALEDIKGRDITVIDTGRLTSLFERMVIASGDSNRQTRALADNVREKVKEAGEHVGNTEGEDTGEWVLLDLGDGGQHFAKVSWARGDQLGLRFTRAFDIACLSEAKPDVAPQSWSRPEFLSAGQDLDSPWAEPWERMSLADLKQELEGFLKR